ncbi:MAG: tripartite tricarboxylate transporter substrate binding protein [Xanthobacteraceae bacterium]|jgi:tripartite-type tricarboxylate transporter receptor subunit TctC
MTASMPQIKFSRRKLMRLAMSAVALPAVPRMAYAESYPARPVHIMLGFPPGTTPDVTARLIGPPLSERLGQQFIVENRTGAGGNIATEFVVKAQPDGYTLLLVTLANAVNATLYGSLNFNFLNDIAPVASIMRTPLVMEVNPAVPARSVAEFIAYAKANPGKINMASGGPGTPQHLAGELFMMMTGTEMVHVPNQAGNAMTDVLGGQVQVIFNPISTSLPFIRQGKLRALAVTSAERVRTLPDIPTVAEFVPGYEASGWYGIGAPRKTPAEIVEKLNSDIGTALSEAATMARFADLDAETVQMSPAGFGKFLSDETQKWGKVVKAANIKID